MSAPGYYWNVPDPSFWGTVPCLLTKVVGTGSRMRIVLDNITDIAKALGRPPTYLIKYFGSVLKTKASFYPMREQYFIEGVHEAFTLERILFSFIREYVLCGWCQSHLTVLNIHANEKAVSMTCNKCGYKCIMHMPNGLLYFILNEKLVMQMAAEREIAEHEIEATKKEMECLTLNETSVDTVRGTNAQTNYSERA